MIPRLRITRDAWDLWLDWNKAQRRSKAAYYAGPTRWCWMPGCCNPSPRYCRGHGNVKVESR